jgi:predicted Fe-Mo cluster-binding NifX family protein
MRYAVSVSSGVISPHFGHCEQFTLIDIDERTKKILKKDLVASPGYLHETEEL